MKSYGGSLLGRGSEMEENVWAGKWVGGSCSEETRQLLVNFMVLH